MAYFKFILIVCFLQFVINNVSGQESDKPEKEFVVNTFRGTTVINAQTVEVLPKKSIEFKIQHRFGGIGIDKSIINEFFGLDLPANIRLSLSYGITDKFYLSIGRTKIKKDVDIEGKYILLKQTKNEIPFSLAIFSDIAITTVKPGFPDNTFLSDSTTLFKYKFSHRIVYNTQIIIARKFGENFSLQITPVFIYSNLVEVEKKNYTLALPVSGRFKYSNNSAIIFEYAYVFNNRTTDFRDPISIGIEFGTAGHVFQFVISTTNNLLEQEIYTNSSVDYLKGKFLFGFNIKRIFWF